MESNKIPKAVQKHRNDSANDILLLASLLERVQLDPGTLKSAATQLKKMENVPKISQNDVVNYSFYGYNVKGIYFMFDEPPNHTHPDKIEHLSLFFDIKVIKEYFKDYSHSDPLKHLEFNIVVMGHKDGKEYISSYHLDRHQEGDNEPLEAHPKYHFQFGGRKLDKSSRDFGQALILDSPRIMHYPMDIILGIDFIVSNFFPKTWEKLKRENEYISLVSSYRDKLLKPYFCSLANYWSGMLNGKSDWSTEEICPQLF